VTPASRRTYGVEWAGPAKRALQRIPEAAAVAAIDLIHGELAANPHRVGRPLHFELEGRYSARRGAYRIIHRIDDRRSIVVIETIAHRRDVYRTDG
jgi:mRNA interferase RelE/StbE